MIYFFTVAAPARSGTMWCSRLFTAGPAYCYHELTTLLHPYPSNLSLVSWLRPWVADHDFEQAQRRWLLECHPGYFPRLWERAYFGQHIVGNSDHFVLEFLPSLWLAWPDMKFVFSTRNGISAVRSRARTVERAPAPVNALRKAELGSDDPFEMACRLWRLEVEQLESSRTWLRRHGAACVDTTLEALTTDLGAVRRVWDWIGIGGFEREVERIRALQAERVNSRDEHTPSPEQAWEGLMPRERELFRAICGDAQRRLGYALPRT